MIHDTTRHRLRVVDKTDSPRHAQTIEVISSALTRRFSTQKVHMFQILPSVLSLMKAQVFNVLIVNSLACCKEKIVKGRALACSMESSCT